MPSAIEIVKEMYAAFGRDDVEGVTAHLAEDVVWSAEGPAAMVFTGVRHGKAETLAGFFGGIAQEHADPKLEMAEFVAEGDRVAAFGRYAVTLKKSGQRVDSPVGHLFKFRGGKVVHYINLLNTAAFMGPSWGHATGVAVYYTPAKMSAAQYDEIIQRLNEAGMIPAPGAFVHACFGEPGQLRVLDVFDSMESFETFGKTLSPIIAEAGVEPGQPEIRPLYAFGTR
jgi:ketosteroid isomerase-like protein